MRQTKMNRRRRKRGVRAVLQYQLDIGEREDFAQAAEDLVADILHAVGPSDGDEWCGRAVRHYYEELREEHQERTAIRKAVEEL